MGLPAPQVATQAAGRLPAAEVSGLWGVSLRVDVSGSEGARWCRRRGLDPAEVAAADAARVLPAGVRHPAWAAAEGRSWGAAGLRLVLPCYDAVGALVGLRAHALDTGAPGPREASPCDPGALRGAVHADPVGRWLLEKGRAARPGDRVAPGGQPDLGGAPLLLWDGRVLVVGSGRAWLHYTTTPRRWRPVTGGWASHAVLGAWRGAELDGPAGEALGERLEGAAVVSPIPIGGRLWTP